MAHTAATDIEPMIAAEVVLVNLRDLFEELDAASAASIADESVPVLSAIADSLEDRLAEVDAIIVEKLADALSE